MWRRYNAGGHKAHYSKATEWDAYETTERAKIPADGRQLIDDFTRPFNERLFELTGRRCNWAGL